MLCLPAERPLQLTQLPLSAPLTLVVLAPHPDDFDAIAVTLRYFHQRGDTIHLAVLTTGASGVEDGYAGAYTAVDKAALREQEQAASCAFFGLPPERLSFLRLYSSWQRRVRLLVESTALYRTNLCLNHSHW